MLKSIGAGACGTDGSETRLLKARGGEQGAAPRHREAEEPHLKPMLEISAAVLGGLTKTFGDYEEE
jgi:hypothetical protein